MFKSTCFLFTLLLVSVSSFKFWPFEQEEQKPAEILKNQLNPIFVGDEEIQRGASITPNMLSEIKGYIETATIYSGSDNWKNAAWIQSKLNQAYPGDWMITIFNTTTNTSIIPNTTFGVSTYSLNGSWWLYWKGANHYQPNLAYYLNRQATNIKNVTYAYCHVLNNMSYYSTDVFKNVVSAIETDTDALMTEAYQIQQHLGIFNPNVTANVLVSKKLPFFSCQWGVIDSNYIPTTSGKSNTVLTFPRI